MYWIFTSIKKNKLFDPAPPMKQVTCPKCDKTFSFDDSRYDRTCNISFICPICRKRFVMTLAQIEAAQESETDSSLGFITILENAFGYRQEFPLHLGDNTIGRASKGTEIDIAIETSDMSMDRRHCIINVKEKGGRPVLTVRDNPSLTGTFLRNTLLGDRERALLHDGDVVSIGAATFIVHIPGEEEEEEYFG